MNKAQMKQMCQNEVNNIVDRMHDLCADGRSDDASALYAEIRDWVVQGVEIEVMSLDYLNNY